MRNGLILWLLAAACLFCASDSWAQETEGLKVDCRTTWDERYFYLAVRVDDLNVRGQHKIPNADIGGDDSVFLYIESDNARGTAVTEKCVAMGVSAAGGAQFLTGGPSGVFEQKAVFSFKYGVSIQGSINNDDDVDEGYSVEIAIPWDLMNASAPASSAMMSFNIVVRNHGSNPGEFVSLSPNVHTEEDIADPSKWSNIVFAPYTFGAVTLSPERVLCTRYVVRAPVINGTINDKEWPSSTKFAINLPSAEGQSAEIKFPIPRTVFAKYCYKTQWDDRREVPYLAALSVSGAPAVQDFPALNLGPWESYDRVGWHKSHLLQMATAGVDVVLPEYMGDAGSRAQYAAKGLECMMSALQELRSENKPWPQVAMLLNVSYLGRYGAAPSLNDEEVWQQLYSNIKGFFDRVPREMRLLVPSSRPVFGQPGNVVFVTGVSGVKDFDASVIEYCSDRFARDFGLPLVWIAGDRFDDTAGFDGAINGSPESRILAWSVGPGVDKTPDDASSDRTIVSRMGGDTYSAAWESALGANARWVVIDSWNRLSDSSEVCFTRQYGGKYLDITRTNAAKLHGARDIDVRYLGCEVPAVVAPKTISIARIVARNTGSLPWRAAEGFSLGYRWYKDNKFYCESKVRRVLAEDVAPGATVSLSVGVAAVNPQGEALPPGDYVVRFEMIRTADNKWFSGMGAPPLVTTLRIGDVPEWSASYIGSATPQLAAPGRTYVMYVMARNGGTRTWPKGVAKLGGTLYRVSDYSHEAGQASEELVETIPLRAQLSSDCKPGETVTFALDARFVTPDGKPLPPSPTDDSWRYELRFDLHNGEQWLSESGSAPLRRSVFLGDADYGVRLVDSNTPAKLVAGKTVDVRVVVSNMGGAVLDPKRTKIGCRWYHLDGTAMARMSDLFAPMAPIAPGTSAIVGAKITAPQTDGQYVVVWDVNVDDKWLSEKAVTRDRDTLVSQVEVIDGRLVPLDLTTLYNASAFSYDTDRTTGDFDGKGGSFPAELIPPDAGGTQSRWYPSGYNLTRDAAADGRVSFLYPDKSPGAKNFFSAAGQTVDVPRGYYSAMHILGASTEGEGSGELPLVFSDGSEKRTLTLGNWGGEPNASETVALQTRHRHNHGGDDALALCRLFHQTIPLDPKRRLAAFLLPDMPGIKIVAITLEKPAAPSKPASR